MQFIKMFDASESKIDVFNFMITRLEDRCSKAMQSFAEEWENAEAMYGYDPLISNAVATIQHLNCEIEEYPARDALSKDFEKVWTRWAVLDTRKKDIQEDIDIVSKLIEDIKSLVESMEQERNELRMREKDMQDRINTAMGRYSSEYDVDLSDLSIDFSSQMEED